MFETGCNVSTCFYRPIIFRSWSNEQYIFHISILLLFFLFQLVSADFEPPKSTQFTGVFISGLHLHNASWDAERSLLVTPQSFCEKQKTQSRIPNVWLHPVDQPTSEEERKKENAQENSFSCPVFTRKPGLKSNAVIHISLPTGESTLCVERNVYLSTTP